MEYSQILWHWGDPQDLRVMGCYSDLKSDHHSELHEFFKLWLNFVDVARFCLFQKCFPLFLFSFFYLFSLFGCEVYLFTAFGYAMYHVIIWLKNTLLKRNVMTAIPKIWSLTSRNHFCHKIENRFWGREQFEKYLLA